jgi:hypothetical protein
VNIWLWILGNSIIAFVPPAALAAALRFRKIDINLGKIFGDGFLYFYSLVLSVSFVVDALKEYLQDPQKIPAGIFVGVFSTSVFFVSGIAIAYFWTQVRRIEDPAADGHEFVVPSFLVAVAVLSVTFMLRWTYGIW